MLRDHPYLATTLWGLVTVALCWCFADGQRRAMLLSGAICLPFLPLAATYNDGSYWTPRHLEIPGVLPITAFGGPVGVEDVICLFIAGARAWFFATLPGRRRWTATATAAQFARRAAAISGAALTVIGMLRLTGVGYVAISFAVPLAVGAAIAFRRPGLRPLAVAGALGSVVASGIELRLYFLLWPDWPSAWAHDAFTSADILGTKLGDLLWWALFGAVHPLVFAYCAGAARAGRSPQGATP